MRKPLRVGIIGASAEGGWARLSHVPAVEKLDGLELHAVVGSSRVKAETAAKKFGAKVAYGHPRDLFKDADIDLVSVCVKVPDHRELVLGALRAGKHVYCEWPLGRNLAEAEELAAVADGAGVHVAIGLQARMNPATKRARELIASHAIGRVLSARVYSSTMAFGPTLESSDLYLEDPDNGATLFTIQAAHTFDLAIAVLGEYREASALTTIQYPKLSVGKDGNEEVRSIADHVLVQARLASGAALALEIAGGRPADDTPFRFAVTGETGELVLEGGAPRGFQSGTLSLSSSGEEQRVGEGELGSMPGEAVNVAAIYAALRDDIVNGTVTAPDFRHAVRLTRLVDDLIIVRHYRRANKERRMADPMNCYGALNTKESLI